PPPVTGTVRGVRGALPPRLRGEPRARIAPGDRRRGPRDRTGSLPSVDTYDEAMMESALEEARGCLAWGDVPVGAVVARGDVVLGAAGNQRERLGDPTAHAAIVALRAAAAREG